MCEQLDQNTAYETVGKLKAAPRKKLQGLAVMCVCGANQWFISLGLGRFVKTISNGRRCHEVRIQNPL